ncbi:hypothetical protein [Halobacteriovorax marinus]|uniref:hypothetical protein n=1 Tax=Halobacteriovorax marinus TaxID=97084 RepID=UPI003A94DE17
MELNAAELKSFATAELNTYLLSSLSIDSNKALKEIEEEILDEYRDLNSEDTKRARLDYFKVNDAKSDDYAEKILELEDNKKVIYGIRHKGANPDLPFVQLKANFSITSKADALEIYQKVRHEFEVFKPLYINFHNAMKVDADFYGSIYMVASTKEIIECPNWSNEGKITFEAIKDNSYYDWYKDGYDQFHLDAPDLKNKVTVNSCSSMEDSLEQGLLKFVYLNEERIGLIAGERSDFLGSSAVYFHEIFISKKWKGRGLAKVVQQKFIKDFCSDLNFVWGTIDAHNLPSYKTAYSNGRRAVRYECFVNL